MTGLSSSMWEKMLQESTDALLRSLKYLQTSGDYADLKLYCKDQEFVAHKIILCPRSEFFTKACTWGQSHDLKCQVDLHEDDPQMIKLLIDYLYRLDYDDILLSDAAQQDDEPPSNEPTSPIADKVKFFDGLSPQEGPEPAVSSSSRVAWDYGLSTKQKRRKEKEMKCSGTWNDRLTQEMLDAYEVANRGNPETCYTDNAHTAPETLRNGRSRLRDLARDAQTERIVVNAAMYALADKYGIEALKSLAKSKFSDAVKQNWNSEASVRGAELVFNDTPSSDLGLRCIVIATLYEHQELIDYEETQELLNSGNGIAWQLLKVLLSRQPKVPASPCESILSD